MEATRHETRRARFDALWAAHYGAVLGYALRRRREGAHDIAADTFLVAWRRLDEVPRDDPLPWLIGTARNAIANQARGERRRVALMKRLGGLARHVGPDPAEMGGSTELRAAFASLRPAQREVIALASWEQLTHAQIAVVLGCSPGAVAVRLHRARERLRIVLDADRPMPSLRGPIESSGEEP